MLWRLLQEGGKNESDVLNPNVWASAQLQTCRLSRLISGKTFSAEAQSCKSTRAPSKFSVEGREFGVQSAPDRNHY